MEDKKWLGSDLVFDIDANEIPECIEKGKVIQIRFCKSCGFSTDQQELKKCPRCGSELSRFDHVDVECINMAKEQALRLVDILENDFGFTAIVAGFSGHRGFHIVAELDDEYGYMTSEDRRELASYIRLDEQQLRSIEEQLTKVSKKSVPLVPRISDGGLRRRIALALARYVDGEIKAYVLGLRPSLSFVEAQKAYKVFVDHFSEITRALPVYIDTKVTIDTAHLVRMLNSINGKTGWRVLEIKNLDFSSFELSPQGLGAEDSKIRIKFLTDIPEIFVIDRRFRFFRGDELVLEYPYASYFIFKEVAEALSIVR